MTNAPLRPLTEEEGRWLLALARDAVVGALRGLPPPDRPAPGGRLAEPQGAFVTLRAGGRLRGCLGSVTAREPLDRCVLRCALAAAFEDPRFPPVRPDEEETLEFEVTALSESYPLQDPSDLVVGRHGLVVSWKGRHGLLLPQVPVEHGWDRMAFLKETCRKAGLGADDWRLGARLEAFTAQVFSERP